MSIRKYIPNFITSLNIACGTVGLVFAFKGRCDVAFLFMITASVFDFLDGFAARCLHAYSDMGKELDSLCDVVSFGVLPSAMLFVSSSKCIMHDSWVPWFSLVIAVFSALRLAKFNIDERQSDGFLGLPTPACALLVGALCYYVAFNPSGVIAIWMAGPVFVPVISVILSILLICELPMFSLKFHKDDSRLLKFKRLAFLILIFIAAAICIIFKLNWSVAVIISLSCYIIKNFIYRLAGLN